MLYFIFNRSGCDLNSPRRPSPAGKGGDEAFDLQTPLHLCCSWGLEKVVQGLIEHGADVGAKVCFIQSYFNLSSSQFLTFLFFFFVIICAVKVSTYILFILRILRRQPSSIRIIRSHWSNQAKKKNYRFSLATSILCRGIFKMNRLYLRTVPPRTNETLFMMVRWWVLALRIAYF